MSHPLRSLREHILRATAISGEGHLASAFSIMDILWVLYHDVLRIDGTARGLTQGADQDDGHHNSHQHHKSSAETASQLFAD